MHPVIGQQPQPPTCLSCDIIEPLPGEGTDLGPAIVVGVVAGIVLLALNKQRRV